MKVYSPKTVLCIHDLSALGRAGLSVILPALAAAGVQPVALPTAVLSSHTGGLGTPAKLPAGEYPAAALEHYRELGISFDYIYSGYLTTPEQATLVRRAKELWPSAFLLVDPVMGDGGKLYSGMGAGHLEALRELCAGADLILPNVTEACLLLGQGYTQPESPESAIALAKAVQSGTGAKCAVVTGVSFSKDLGCAGSEYSGFWVGKRRQSRSFPGTGDLFASVLLGALARGNALSAAVDTAAAFVTESIQNTADDADTRLGVWYEPLLSRLSPEERR